MKHTWILIVALLVGGCATELPIVSGSSSANRYSLLLQYPQISPNAATRIARAPGEWTTLYETQIWVGNGGKIQKPVLLISDGVLFARFDVDTVLDSITMYGPSGGHSTFCGNALKSDGRKIVGCFEDTDNDNKLDSVWYAGRSNTSSTSDVLLGNEPAIPYSSSRLLDVTFEPFEVAPLDASDRSKLTLKIDASNHGNGKYFLQSTIQRFPVQIRPLNGRSFLVPGAKPIDNLSARGKLDPANKVAAMSYFNTRWRIIFDRESDELSFQMLNPIPERSATITYNVK